MNKVNAVPEDMRTVTPHLICDGAANAIEFYKKAFGATEVARLPGPDGKLMHAHIRIGDSALFLMDPMPGTCAPDQKAANGSPVTIHLYVEDADAVVARAVKAGAKITMPLEDAFWGDRYGRLEDPFGHCWSVATHIRDMSAEEVNQACRT